MSLEELMNIEVTSVSKRPEKLSETASAIQVITRDDIRQSGATTIPEALRLAGNLNVAQVNAHDWAISSRGFNTSLANKLLVMIDGRTVYTPLFSGVFWDAQDYLLEDIDRIEVVSGPGGSLWGANAVNGVINIITKSAQDTQGTYLEAGGGSTLQAFTGVRHGAQLAPDVYVRTYAKYFDRDNEVFASSTNALDSWNRGQGGFRMDAQPDGAHAFTLQGDIYAANEGMPEQGDDANVSGGNLLGRWLHTQSKDSETTLQIYYDRTHLSLPAAPLIINGMVLTPGGRFKDDLNTYDVDFQHQLQLNARNQALWGLGYRHMDDDVENAPALAFLPPDQSQDLISGFAQNEFMLRDDLFLTLGSKVEHNDYTDWEVEPSGRLRLNVSEGQMVWTAISRAVRTPSRVDREIAQAAPPFLAILHGNPEFTSETVIAYELGYRAQFAPELAATFATFYNDYDDVRSTTATPETVIPFFFENNLKGESYGFELGSDYQPLDWWRLRLAYAFLDTDLSIKPGHEDFNATLNETADPQHQVGLRSSMNLPRQVELDAGLRWVDTLHNNDGPTIGTVPSYFELDMRVAWHVTPNTEISVVGQNLLHDEHPEYGFPGPNRVEIQRSVYGKIAWRF